MGIVRGNSKSGTAQQMFTNKKNITKGFAGYDTRLADESKDPEFQKAYKAAINKYARNDKLFKQKFNNDYAKLRLFVRKQLKSEK